MFKNFSAGMMLLFVASLSVVIGLGTDQEVLALLPPLAKMLIPKIITYSGGATLLYKLKPHQGPSDDAAKMPEKPLTPPQPPQKSPFDSKGGV